MMRYKAACTHLQLIRLPDIQLEVRLLATAGALQVDQGEGQRHAVRAHALAETVCVGHTCAAAIVFALLHVLLAGSGARNWSELPR